MVENSVERLDLIFPITPNAANAGNTNHRSNTATGVCSVYSNWREWPPTSEDSWRMDLSAEYESLVTQAAELSDGGLHWREYLRAPDLVDLERLRTRMTTLLWQKYGFALVSIGDHISDDAMRLLFLLIGRAMGRNVAPSPGGQVRALFAVTATDDPTIGGNYGGNGRNARSLALHTDGSGIHSARVDVLGMLCLRPAQRGGVSRVADARSLYSVLDEEARTLLSVPLPRTDPYTPGLPPERLICRPVFDLVPGSGDCGLRFSYHPHRVRDGIRMLHGGAITPPLELALSALDSALESSAFDILLGRGDILILNNWVVAHGRTAFSDDLCQPRLIERLWVEIDGW